MPVSGHFWSSRSISFFSIHWRAFSQTTPCRTELSPWQRSHFNAFLIFLHQSFHSLLSPRWEMPYSPSHLNYNWRAERAQALTTSSLNWTLGLGRKQWMKPSSNKHLPYLLRNIIAKVSCNLTACPAHAVFQPQTLLRQKKKKKKKKLLPYLPQYY